MGSTRLSNNAAGYLEGIEAYFEASVVTVAKRLRAALDSGPSAFVDTRLDDFLDTFCQQLLREDQALVGMPPEPSVLKRQLRAADHEVSVLRKGMPVLEPGETRPLLTLRVGDRSPWGERYPAGDAKTAMLYAKEVVLMDPSLAFTRYWRQEAATRRPLPSDTLTRAENARAFKEYYAGPLRARFVPQQPTLEGLSREEWLVRAVEQYAALAPAIRSGYLDTVFVDPSSPWSSWRPGEEYIRIWETQSGSDRDKEKIDESMRDILLAVSVAVASPGLAHVVARPGFEEALVHHYRDLLEGRSRRMRTLSAIPSKDDRMMMGRIFELNLHGVDFTQVQDLVSVRDSDLFADVRVSMRDAVVAAQGEQDQMSAQAAAREVLSDHAARLKARSLTGSLREAILPYAVAYSLGGFAGVTMNSWQPMLPLIGQTAIDVGRDRHRERAIKAQRSLYIALSKQRDPKAEDLGAPLSK